MSSLLTWFYISSVKAIDGASPSFLNKFMNEVAENIHLNDGRIQWEIELDRINIAIILIAHQPINNVIQMITITSVLVLKQIILVRYHKL